MIHKIFLRQKQIFSKEIYAKNTFQKKTCFFVRRMQDLQLYCDQNHLPRPEFKTWCEGDHHNPRWFATCAKVTKDAVFTAKTKKEAIHLCANAIVASLCGSVFQEKEVQHEAEENAFKLWDEYHQKQGLATPLFAMTQTGQSHCPTWQACYKEQTFNSVSKKGARNACAAHFLQQQQKEMETKEEELFPTYPLVNSNFIALNPKTCVYHGYIVSFDIEWDISTEHFVCGAVACDPRTSPMVYVYTDEAIFTEHLSLASGCVVFAGENDQRMFPNVFARIQRCIDVRTLLPQNVFSSTVGLAHLIRYYFHKTLSKSLQVSFSSTAPLQENQIQYVATDAHATWALFDTLARARSEG